MERVQEEEEEEEEEEEDPSFMPPAAFMRMPDCGDTIEISTAGKFPDLSGNNEIYRYLWTGFALIH